MNPTDSAPQQPSFFDDVTIPLSKQGKHSGLYESIVSWQDADLANLNWHATNTKRFPVYARHNPTTTSYIFLHRAILERMLGRELISGEQVDHINGDGLDNRRSNLRLASQTQNQHNRGMPRTNTSGYIGVSFNKSAKKWSSRISVNGKRIILGYFNTPEEAYKAYCEAAEKYHGEFANFGGEE